MTIPDRCPVCGSEIRNTDGYLFCDVILCSFKHVPVDSYKIANDLRTQIAVIKKENTELRAIIKLILCPPPDATIFSIFDRMQAAIKEGDHGDA